MTRVASLAVLLLVAPTVASAQKLTPADAGEFMDVWSLRLDSPQGSFEQTLALKDEDGQVVAEISSQMQPEVQKTTDDEDRRKSRLEVHRELLGQPV